MNNTIFEITETKSELNPENPITYGIVAFTVKNDVKIKTDEVLDVSPNLNFVKQLVEKFNQFDLHIEHFRDVLYDCVYAEYSVNI